jgi:chaperonin cofactor prefoldin
MLYEIHNENQNIIVPLQNNNKKLQQLESNLDSFSKQKQQLDTQKQYLKRAEEELKVIEWDHEVLFQQLEALQKDNVAQKKAFSRTIYSAQQESNYENLLLENRIRKLSKSTNVNSAAIVEIFQKADIGLDDLNTSKAAIIDVVKTKNNTVRLLQEQLKRVNADYNNILKKCALKTTKATCVKPIINS